MAELNTSENRAADRLPHVLVIDDEATSLFMVSMRLKNCGFTVSSAGSTLEAYELLSRKDYKAIITDVVMPGEDGISFFNKVQQLHPDIPVIIMTALSQIDMAVDVIKGGAFDLIHKPVDMEYLCKVTERAVEYHKLRQLERHYREELESTVAQRTAQLENALAELESARLLLVKAANEKSEFIAQMTHEMRTPMNGVIGAIELLENEPLSGNQREYVQIAKMAANNMMELVDWLLSFAQGNSKDAADSGSVIPLHTILKALPSRYNNSFALRGIVFTVDIADDVPERLKGDGEQLQRLLDILIGNALKFTERGSVRVKASITDDGIKPKALRLVVQDSGIGIPSDMLDKIFEPFTQVEETLNRRYGGTGLGLSIARQISAVLNGSIWAESVVSEGSSFIFMMKLEPA